MFLKYNKITQLFFTAALIVTSYNSFARSTAHDWAKITQPSQGEAQSIGSYTNGCVAGAQTLPLDGTGYQVMRLSRNRFYGHPNLIQFIENLGAAAVTEKIGTLLIGDLGQPRGGPTLSGHRSHQSGLDVDIWFLLSEQANKRQLNPGERESWSANSVVDGGGKSVNQNWTAAHERMLEIAAMQPEVERIFVNPAIKLALCQHKTENSAAWLYKIRPWWKHDDHFHVRLHCPEGSVHCERQQPLSKDEDCGEGLAWWFTEEAKHPKPATHKAPPPPLPALCEQLLYD
jgi:penicillin-insensitive murein DD-endopeptidase